MEVVVDPDVVPLAQWPEPVPLKRRERGFEPLTGHVTDEIIIDPSPKMGLVEQLNAALYAANAYGVSTKIVSGDDIGYIVSERTYDDLRIRQLDEH